MKKRRENHPGSAWIEWCSQHVDELPLPIKRAWWDRDVANLKFHGAHPGLRICAIRRDEIVTSVVWQGRYLDELDSQEVSPLQHQDGHW